MQAVEGGIDLVALAGTGMATPTGRNEAVIGRVGVKITGPRDLVGKRIGIPGIGTILDVLFRNWLARDGVSAAQMTMVEVGAPALADSLRAGSVDAVVCNDPILYRILAEPGERFVGYIMDALKGDVPIIVYGANGEWARAHRGEVTAFRACCSSSPDTAPVAASSWRRARSSRARARSASRASSAALSWSVDA